MSSAKNTATLSDTKELIKNVGCVLTAYTRIASAIAGREISLEDANKKAMKMGLFQTGQDGQHNALSPESGAKLITALVDDPTISVTYDMSLSTSDLTTASSTLLLLQGDSREFYATGRILTTDAARSQSGQHTLNIDSSAVKSDPSVPGNRNIKVNDTSGVRKQMANDSRTNTLQRIDVFQVRRSTQEL
jgi:hypothetical protein